MKFQFIYALCMFLTAITANVAPESVSKDLSTTFEDKLDTDGSVLTSRKFHLEEDTPTPTLAPTLSFAPTVSSKPSISFKPSTTKKPTQKPTIGIYLENPNVVISLYNQQAIVGSLTILLFIFMALEFLSPEILFMVALIIIMLCQILTLTETLSGFSNESMITIGTLFLVIGGVEKSHMVDYMARKTFGMTGSTTIAKFRMYIACFLLSVFFNNTPLVAILLPVVKDWARVRNISASQLLIPLSYSVLAGSFGSMIGTSTNLTVQGLMQADRGVSFSFFAPLPIGIVCFVIILVYQVAAGPYLLPHHKNGLLRAVRDKAENLVAEVFVSKQSPFVGKTVETMMNALGIAPSRVIKIRRKIRSLNDETATNNSYETTPPITKSSSTGMFDLSYIKSHVAFWAPEKPSQENANQNGYSAQATEEVPVDIEVDLEDGNTTAAERKSPSAHQYTDIIAPEPMEILTSEDVVFISSAQDVMEKLMKSIAGESKGLFIMDSNVLALPGYGSELVEVVLSDINPFIGKSVGEVGGAWAKKYKCAIITARGKDWIDSEHDDETEGNDIASKSFDEIKTAATSSTAKPTKVSEISIGNEPKTPTAVVARRASGEGDIELTSIDGTTEKTELNQGDKFEGIHHKIVSEHVLRSGDVMLCVTNEKEVDYLKGSRDFFVCSTVGALPKPISFYLCIPMIIFIVMLIVVATEQIDMCPAALTVTVVFFIGGWITYEEIPKLIDLRLLMLMGCSLSFAKSMTKSGLALKIAQGVASGNPTPFNSLILIYVVTLIITELISNNAAAALMYPISVALADELGVDFKPFAMGVLIASTAGFMSPIGYQTHVMVWGPGGYKFKDFLIFGLFPDVVYWIVGCALIAAIYPF